MPDEADPWARWNELAQREPATLSSAERQLYAFGWMRTELNNGGFHQLFFNSAGDVAPDAVAACREHGAGEVAALLVRAMAVVGDAYPTDRPARQAALDDLGEDELDQLEELDGEYFDVEATHDLDATMRRLAGRI